ncbi:shikimate kinase [Bacillus sp. FJAT-45350]|uniref:shikimate kinase n=1 Tax=Bacillus sp. FJAT-45350 TaxID=2011014 RepID=UPI000BB8DC3E|nr:shikimate kinase [Bacillus sp. FJAT-45350]
MGLVYLTGFMGSGKTTVGKELGKAFNFQVIDTDEYIEKQQKQSISSIFAEYGEEGFRKLETETLNNINGEDMVITTGGGIIIKDENRQIMQTKGKVIFLSCSLNEIIRRTEGDTTRPLLKGKKLEEIANLYESRLPLYQEAELVVDTTNKSVTDIVKEIKEQLNI